MKYSADIAQKYELVVMIAGKNMELFKEANDLITAAADRKDRRVFTPNELICLVSQIKQRCETIKANNDEIDKKLEEIGQYAAKALGEGFPANF